MASHSSLQKFLTIFLSVIASVFCLFVLYMAFSVKAGPLNPNKSNSVEVHGVVDSLYEGGIKDLVFKLKDDPNTYYINRALENGFDLKTLEKELIGERITLWYAKHRSRPNGGGHMMQMQYKDSLYYTEWQIPLASTN